MANKQVPATSLTSDDEGRLQELAWVDHDALETSEGAARKIMQYVVYSRTSTVGHSTAMDTRNRARPARFGLCHAIPYHLRPGQAVFLHWQCARLSSFMPGDKAGGAVGAGFKQDGFAHHACLLVRCASTVCSAMLTGQGRVGACSAIRMIGRLVWGEP